MCFKALEYETKNGTVKSMLVCSNFDDSKGMDTRKQFSPNPLIYNSSDSSSLFHDFGTSNHREMSHDNSIMVGTHDACFGHDKSHDISHVRTRFRHFGAADTTWSQMLNDDWLERVRQAKVMAHQAKIHLQRDFDSHDSMMMRIKSYLTSKILSFQLMLTISLRCIVILWVICSLDQSLLVKLWVSMETTTIQLWIFPLFHMLMQLFIGWVVT